MSECVGEEGGKEGGGRREMGCVCGGGGVSVCMCVWGGKEEEGGEGVGE